MNVGVGLIRIEISVGEALDRKTILEIKTSKIRKKDELKLAKDELDALDKRLAEHGVNINSPQVFSIFKKLRDANLQMWNAMQQIYDSTEFNQVTTKITLDIIEINKQRAFLKREIDQIYKSSYSETKSFF